MTTTDDQLLLQTLRDLGPFYYQPNPGNLGDQVITQATREWFTRHTLPCQPFDTGLLDRGTPFTLVYGGGGPFVPYYGMVPEIMRLLGHPLVRRAVILPSSFHQCAEVAQTFDKRFTVFCREESSYLYLTGLGTPARLLLADDMAFTLDARALLERAPDTITADPAFRDTLHRLRQSLYTTEDGRKILLMLRQDAESRQKGADIRRRYKTFDLSGYSNEPTHNPQRTLFLSTLFLAGLDQADIILTDRLHGAICAQLLGKETWMLDNTYGKLAAVYDSSLRDRAAGARNGTVLLRTLEEFPYREAITSTPQTTDPKSKNGTHTPGTPGHKILVGICSSQGYSGRRDAVRQTWLSRPHPDVECLFFLGGEVPERERADTVGLDAPDTYNALPQKILAFLRYALDHHDFDWLFKCDDDTYLDLSRLPDLADDRYGITGDTLLATRRAPSGGAGYMLSRQTVERLVTPSFAERVPASGAEDLIIGQLALAAGAVPCATPRLFMSNTRYPAPDNDTISAHWCGPELMRTLHTLRHGTPATLYRGTHAYWQDELLFYPGGIFRRRRTSCYGWWSLGEDDVLVLRWKMWKPEQLAGSGDTFVGSPLRLDPLDGLPTLRDLTPEKPAPAGQGKATDGPAGHRTAKTANANTAYIHAGCGDRFLEGWLNVDLPHYDLTRPLPWTDGTVKALFLEQVAESLTPEQLADFLKEAWRVLTPGGILRLAFTDTGRLAAEAPAAWRRLMQQRSGLSPLPGWGLEALMSREGQRSFWSADSLTGVLTLAGFTVTPCQPGHSPTAELCGLERAEERPEYPFELLGRRCLEAQKPQAAPPQPCPPSPGRKAAPASPDSRTSPARPAAPFLSTRTPAILPARMEEQAGPCVAPHFYPGPRTGNRLFQIAAVYAHALRHGLECRIPWRYEEITSRLYEMLGPTASVCPNGGYDGPVTYHERGFRHTPIPASITHGRLSGYFQTEKYFADHEKEIRTLFSPLAAPRREGEAGVHLRMGDYLNFKHKYQIYDADFLEKALGRFSDNIKTLHIFSDSPRQALDLVASVPAASRFELVLNEDGILPALRAMSSMQELIISCSTFSWWGAWLGSHEKVIVHKKWFVGEISDYEDIYRPGWIRL